MMKARVLAAGALCAAFPLASCSGGSDGKTTGDRGGSGSSHAAGPTLPAGYKLIGGEKNGFAVGVPDGWQTIDFDSATALKALNETGVDANSAQRTVNTLKQNNAAFALDPNGVKRDGFATNLNGFCAVGSRTSADALTSQLSGIGATDIQTAGTSVNGKSALKATYTRKVATVTTVGLQYQVDATGGKTCVITLTGKQGVNNPFEQIALTIRTF